MNLPDTLIVHIGLPKTATTTMQHLAFPKFPGYICGTESQGPQGDSAQRLLHLYQEGKFHPEFGTPQWNVKVRNWWEMSRLLNESLQLVSLEGLYRWCDPVSGEPWPYMGRGDNADSHRVGTHPIVSFIEALRQALQTKIGVVLTVRNQAAFAASLYSQLSYRIHRSGQKDFERRTHQMIERQDPFFDWGALSKSMVDKIGKEYFLCLVYEDGINENLAKLSNFLGGGFSFGQITERHNSRSISRNSWQAKQQAQWLSFIGEIWPPQRASQTRSILTAMSSKTLRLKPRYSSINLSEKTRRSFQAAYRTSNRDLEKFLSSELPPSEYFE